MLQEVKSTLQKEWEVQFTIRSRDENVVVDLLALEAMSMHMEFLSLISPLESIQEALHEDLFLFLILMYILA